MLCCFPVLFHTYTCSHCMCQVTVCLNHLCLSRWDTLISIFAVDIVIGLLVAVFFFYGVIQRDWKTPIATTIGIFPQFLLYLYSWIICLLDIDFYDDSCFLKQSRSCHSTICWLPQLMLGVICYSYCYSFKGYLHFLWLFWKNIFFLKSSV